MIATKDIVLLGHRAQTPSLDYPSAMSSDSQTIDLSQSVALVTGGSRGIGLAIAEHSLDAGASVAITGRERPSTSTAARQRLVAAGPARGSRRIQADRRPM